MATRRLERHLARLGFEPRLVSGRSLADIQLLLDAELEHGAQSYQLEIGADGVCIVGRDAVGLFYGVCTLLQWIRIHSRPDVAAVPPTLPGLRIEDWPDLPVRGVMLDVSRNKVPALATLKQLVERLAGWKINQFQLYTEHTFAYHGHEVVWRHATPLTSDEIRELDRFCRRRAIALVPNQNSFGHFHRWLVHEPYRQLAECPEGVEHPFSEQVEPFSLCPLDPGALELLAGLYDQLRDSFSSRLINVGLDETFDLGRGRSAPACRDRGRAEVYLEFVGHIHELLQQRGFRMQFWADVLHEHPELVTRLPDDVIPLEWGYEVSHPFAVNAERLAASGLEFYVCPGTSSWNSLGGRLHNALGNLAQAADAARSTGARGYLITDWGDNGHLQPLPVSYPGFLAGAAFAWSRGHSIADGVSGVAEHLDLHAFEAPGLGLGSLAAGLGEAYRHPGIELKNGSVLFHLLLSAHQSLHQPRFEALTPAALDTALGYLEELEAQLSRLIVPVDELALVQRELRWATAMLAFSCRLGIQRLRHGGHLPLATLPPKSKDALRRQLQPLLEELRPLWLARNRAGGFDDSRARLERIVALLS
jgi:hypothetical protein